MGYLKSIGTFFIYVGAFLATVTFLPGLPPEATFEEYSIVPPKELPGELGVINERLSNSEVLFKGKLEGPEAFASYNGELYTGVVGGYIMKITKDKLVPVAKLGKKCEGIAQNSTCGKPLGLKFDKKGALYVCDSSNGLFKVDIKTGKYEKLVDIDEVIEGKPTKIINSVDIASNGDLYWSSSSSEIYIDEITVSVLTNPTGRLYRYNAATKKNKVLIDNLGFANGVALSEDESFVIVGESVTSRIVKYYLKGSKAGKHEIVAEGLPGVLDNIHPDGESGFLVGIFLYADSQHPQIFQSVIPHPYLRKMFARLIFLYKTPFKYLKEYFPEYAEIVYPYFPGTHDPQPMIDDKIKCVLRIDANGKVIDAAYTTSDKITHISSAFVHNEYLWIGSPSAQEIHRVPLKQAFPSLASNEKKTSAPEKKASVSENKASAPEKKASVSENKASAPEKKASISENKASAPEKKASISDNKASAPEKKASISENKASAPEKKASISENKASASEKKASAPEKKASPPEQKPSFHEKKDTQPEKKSSSSEKKASPPEKKPNTPEKKVASPTKQKATTPEKKASTPQKTASSPEKKGTTSETGTKTTEKPAKKSGTKSR